MFFHKLENYPQLHISLGSFSYGSDTGSILHDSVDLYHAGLVASMHARGQKTDAFDEKGISSLGQEFGFILVLCEFMVWQAWRFALSLYLCS